VNEMETTNHMSNNVHKLYFSG